MDFLKTRFRPISIVRKLNNVKMSPEVMLESGGLSRLPASCLRDRTPSKREQSKTQSLSVLFEERKLSVATKEPYFSSIVGVVSSRRSRNRRGLRARAQLLRQPLRTR